MDEDKSKKLIELELDQLIISMDGLTKKTYEKVRVKSDYDTVINNIDNLLRLRGNRKKPFIRMQYTEVPENRHETEEFYKYWKDKVDEVSISYYLEFDSVEKSKENNKEVPVYRYSCEQLWQRVVVLCDGRVSLCGTDIIPHVVVGNANTQSISDIWQSKKLNNIRRLHKEGGYSKMPMCKICVHHQSESDKFQLETLFK
jgi:radical SAM protein with 4Fe4S-binding SPASM domain